MTGKKAFTILELVIVAAIFIAMVLVLTPFVRIAKSRANKINCAGNLMRISLSLHKYASGHGDSFPPDLKSLYSNYIKDTGVFDCPSAKSAGTPGAPDYEYTAGLTETSPGKEIIVQDIDGNHKKSGKNIVRVDGTVEWLSGAR